MFKTFASALISMAIVFQAVSLAPPARAAGCSSVGGQAGSLKHSGLVTGNSAKVCGREIWKLLPTIKPIKKPVIRKTPAKKIHWKNEFSVVPDRPRIGVTGPLNVAARSLVLFTSLAARHQRNRMLLWYPTQVRFKPISTTWNFGDGSGSQVPEVSHSWSQSGIYSVNLEVEYSVKYRIVGKSEWVPLPGTIRAASLPIMVRVGQGPNSRNGMAALVHWNCIQKQTAIGC